MDEFPYHDELPAAGPWPGGKRYGYQVERLFKLRAWSDADRERAHAEGVTLPEMDTEIIESWWDGPARYWVTLEPATIDFDDPGATITHRTHTAQRWVYRTWQYVPPWRRHASG